MAWQPTGPSAAPGAAACPSCNSPAPPGSRFCGSCGQPLRPLADERRVVTVLFADLVGFTTVSETLDPEQVKNLVDRCFERLVADIAAYGGRVDKIVGDAIVALFGAPVAHEDDAERAVRAGLQLQRTLADFVAGAVSDDGRLQLRVGINTGEVLVGALRAGGEYTAMGDVVNTASRLQTAAQPGQVIVGAATWEATRDVVRYTPLGAVKARGREEPVEAWAAEEAIAPPGSRTGRARGPLVGRDDELVLLTKAIDSSVARRRAQLVLIVAEAGMGKTRLAEEVATLAECAHDAVVLEGRCVPYGEANVWWPVAEAVRTGCRIGPTDGLEQARALAAESVANALGDGDDDERQRVTTGLLQLMGYETPLAAIDPVRAREEVQRSLLLFVEGVTRERPVIVVLSDLHWADDAVLELGDVLLERVADRPFVLVATARQHLLERWQPKQGRHNVLVQNLDPLGRDAAATLLDELADSDVPGELRDLLLDRSGGNPFFLEELVALVNDTERSGDLPHTLRGLVSARLDALGPAERGVLEDAAVLGRRGTVEALRLMAKAGHVAGDDEVDRVVERLQATDILDVEDGKWSFRSDLVREVTYGTLTKSVRARRHADVARWMEEHEPPVPATVDRIAHHFATAAELAQEIGSVDRLDCEDLSRRAVSWLERAVDQAAAGELHVVAKRLATQALDLLGDDDPASRRRFLIARARAATQLRELPEAEDDLAAAMAAAEAASDELGRAQVLLCRGDVEQKQGDVVASTATLTAAVDAFAALGDVGGEADARRALGFTRMMGDDGEGAKALFLEALERYREVGDRRGEAWVLQNLAWLAYSAGRADDAEQWLIPSADTFSEIGDQGGLGWALGLLAFVRYHQGRFGEAEDLGERMLAESRQRHDRWATGMMLTLLSSLRLWTGRASSAVEPAREACALFEQMHDSWGNGNAIGILGRALLATGRVDEAFAVLRGDQAAGIDGASAKLDDVLELHQLNAAAQSGQPGLAPNSTIADRDANGFADGAVSKALVDAQAGNAAAAAARLEQVFELNADRGYAASAFALALAAAGEGSRALVTAGDALELESSTYSDRCAALLARALVHGAHGDAAAAGVALTAAHGVVDDTDDVLLRRVVALAEGRIAERLGRAGAGEAVDAAIRDLTELGIGEHGWDTLFRLAVDAPQHELA